LECYGKARNEALTIKNGRAGWRATGLWPVDIMKVLNHLMVTTAAQDSPLTPEEPKIMTPMKDLPLILLETPRAGVDIRKRAEILQKR